jgi:hypothetical protein
MKQFLKATVMAKSQQADSLMKRIDDLGNYLLYRNHDTNYISNYGDEVAVKLVSVNKYNYFRIRDRINNTQLRYRPVHDISLGMGVSYKWFALDITFSLGLRNNSDFENTKSFDFQGRMFSSKQFVSTTIQYYQGYKLSSVSGTDVNINEESTRREDIRTINFGLQYMYSFNYTKFSLKAPFVFNEVQRKSAGSTIIGASFSMFVMDADSSIVPPEISTYFEPNIHLLDLNVLSVALSFGYMYSFVYREHFFLTLSLIPGINFNSGDYLTENRNTISPNFNLKLNSMNAIGYNGRKFFTGFNFLADGFFSRIDKKLTAEIGHGKSSFFVGYRFGGK